MSETVRIGILGCGNVGGPLVGLIEERARAIEARTGLRLQVARVAVRNLSRERAVPIAEGLLTREAAEVVEDPTIDLVVEVIGGIEPARELILAALKHGKPVVTANKELLANVGAEVFNAADAAGCDLLFEAAVAGGIPLVRALRESLAGEPIRRIMGIVNGTTNFILTRMTDGGASYGDALAEAQSLGYAERDPTADVEGYDAGAKAAIIASIAFGVRVIAGDVYHEGISQITADDIAAATRLGYVVKLLAIAERFDDGALAVRVHPAMVPVAHPLASVRDSYNAVFVEGDAVGSLMFYGRGAGGRPTASAVLGDVIDAASNLRKGTHASIGMFERVRMLPIDETSAEYYIPLEVVDRPGVLHAVTGAFAAHDVSIRTAEQEGLGDDARLVFITHTAREADVQATLHDLRHLDVVKQVGSILRVVGTGSVKYVSTRGAAPVVDFAGAMLGGLASDGGLYVPETWPPLPSGLGRTAPYAETAAAVIWPFVDGVDRDDFGETCVDAYSTFRHDAVCPLVQLSDDTWLLELFHGPTLAFKDVALQLVGRLMDDELGRRGERTSIVVATSGDTGSAAIEACRGRANLDIYVLHPAGRVSEVQRRQMTTVLEPNVHNLALEGTFDDCQDMVKALFADAAFREAQHLGALNSINWARVVAQVVYYVTSAISLGASEAQPVSFAVPTGNFGNVLSGWVAKQMGVPIHQLIIGSNRNDIVTRVVNDGRMEIADVVPTMSPSMDIQISSNFERVLFELNGRDGGLTAEQMAVFRASGRMALESDQLRDLQATFTAASVDEQGTLEQIARTYAGSGVVVDPHTAVGLRAVEVAQRDRDIPVVALATAHPAKFPDAVERAIGTRPALPEHLADLFDRPERYAIVPNDIDAVKAVITNGGIRSTE